MKVCAQFAFFTLTIVTVACSQLLHEKFAWRELEFSWPSETIREESLHNGNYIPANNLPLAFDVWKDKAFFTVPRWKTGVVSSLNYVEFTDDTKTPIFHPYPNFDVNQLSENNEDVKIVSAFGVRVDECDRLWVVDSGVTNLLGEVKKFQNPSVFIYNLNTNELIRRFEIPQTQIKSESFFVNVFVDTQRGKCEETFAYIVDIYGYGIIVYDYSAEKSWRVTHNYFAFDPIHGDFLVNGIKFQWHDGIFGMALGKIRNNDGERTLYFHALASLNEFRVENNVLKNETFATDHVASYHSYEHLGSRSPGSQSSVEVFDVITDVIFYTQINLNAVGCWNTKKPFTVDNQGVVAADNETLVFPNDLRIDSEGNLLVLSNRMPLFIYSELPKGEINYRILVGKTEELIKGTPCE